MVFMCQLQTVEAIQLLPEGCSPDHMHALLSNPAVAEAAGIALAVICHLQHQSHSSRQQQQQQVSRRRWISASRTTITTTTTSSSSCSSQPRTFNELLVHPDHSLVPMVEDAINACVLLTTRHTDTAERRWRPWMNPCGVLRKVYLAVVHPALEPAGCIFLDDDSSASHPAGSSSSTTVTSSAADSSTTSSIVAATSSAGYSSNSSTSTAASSRNSRGSNSISSSTIGASSSSSASLASSMAGSSRSNGSIPSSRARGALQGACAVPFFP